VLAGPASPGLADEFPQVAESLAPGAIGENLDTDALDESAVRVGDIWQLGSALVQVSQPRSLARQAAAADRVAAR
jgi:MOSC domain-containing protein YiiM